MLKGTLDDFTLPDVFRLMSFTRKTGKLDVVRSAGAGKVFFREGEVYYAESSISREPLGQKLIKARVLSEGQLMRALDEHAASGRRVGEVLVEHGAVTEEQLQAAVAEQVQDAVFDLLRWDLGEFTWQPGVVADVEVPIAVSGENLIMEASRRLDELEVIARKIPSERAVLAMAATPPEGAVEINITPEEWRMLVLVNGVRTVHEIAAMVGKDDFSVMRSLYGLVSAGLVEVADEGIDAEVGAADAEPEIDAAADAEPIVDEPVVETATIAAPVAEEDDAEVAVAEAPAPEAEVATEGAAAEVVLDDVVDPYPFAAVIDEPSSFDAGVVGLDVDAAPAGLEPFSFEGDEDLVAASPNGTASDEPMLVGAAEPDVQEDVDPLVPGDEDVPPYANWPDPVSVETFDAPTPSDLLTETPAAPDDPFLSDLLANGPRAVAPPPAPTPAPAPPPVQAPRVEPPAAPAVDPAPAAEPAPHVDRAAVVRELAGLFDDDERPQRPAPTRDREGADEPDERKRVEDDDQVTRGLISRLIDGVKGL